MNFALRKPPTNQLTEGAFVHLHNPFYLPYPTSSSSVRLLGRPLSFTFICCHERRVFRPADIQRRPFPEYSPPEVK